MGPEEPEFDDHGVVGMAQRDQLVALIRKSRPGLPEILPDRELAVVHLIRRDEFVTWVVESSDHRVEVVNILGFHVKPNDLLSFISPRMVHRLISLREFIRHDCILGCARPPDQLNVRLTSECDSRRFPRSS